MAASIEEVGFELGGSMGVALFGSLMTIAYAAALPPPGATLPAIVRDSLDEALRVADALPGADAMVLRDAGRSAFGTAYRAVLTGVGLLWFATGVFILLRGSRRYRKPENRHP
jgi:DHA2 family multidrug resistance protein-like MFS transporter